MAAYPTSSGVSSSIMAIRFPVVRSRYCVQRTALGAADVPEVNSKAHRTSTSGSADATSFDAPALLAVQAASSARPSDSPATGGSSPSAKRSETRTPPVSSHLLHGRTELGLVSRFGDHELHVGMVDVAGEVLAVSGVVQPHDGGPDQPRATQREDVVGRVVEEDTDMRGAVGMEAGAEQCGKALGFGEELGMAPHAVAEVKRGPIGVALVGAVPAQQGGRVRSRKRHLGQRWGEGGRRFAGHGRSISSDRFVLSGGRPIGCLCALAWRHGDRDAD